MIGSLYYATTPDIYIATPNIALEFSRLCMGWENAGIDGPFICLPGETYQWFKFTELAAVMDAAVEFIDRNRLAWFRLDYSMPDRCFYAKVRGDVVRDIETEGRSPDPCRALMLACVDAATKLEAA